MIEPGQYGMRLLENAYPGRRFTPASPYWERSARFDEHIKRLAPGGVPRGSDRSRAADLRLALAQRPPLRTLAGGDAEIIAGAYRQLEFEAFEQSMRQALD